MSDLAARIRAQMVEAEQLAQAYLRRRESEGTDRETWGYKLILATVAAHRKILDWCGEIVADIAIDNYGQFGLLKDHPNALAVTLAVETVLALAAAYGIDTQEQR